MQPLSLTLKGFRGIRDGLGRDVLTLDFERLADGAELIAIVGANGRGKTTVMDNMHPYLTMPSRAAMAGPGGFAYYEHVCLPENEKDLTWAHDGRSYRSQVVIRLNGRRKTEAFLLVLADDGAWKPVALDDGTVSDGKVDTYTRCVEAVCGSADTFFTSVFSAQGKRQLSAYRNAEIKTLLADLLGQEEIRGLGQKASETARLLKAGLAAIRQEQAGLDAEAQRIEAEQRRFDGAQARVAQRLAGRQAAQAAQESARTRYAQLIAEREQSRGVEARRGQLQGECHTVIQAGTQAIDALKAQDQGEVQRLERLEQRIAQRLAQECNRRQVLQNQRRQCLAVLAGGQAVRHAESRLPMAEGVLSQRSAQVGAWRQQVQALTQCQAAKRMVQQKLSGIEREAGQAALKAEELARRFGLTGEVPCAGTDLQGQCQLLGDARDAKALIPSAQGTIQRLGREKVAAQRELDALCGQHDELAGAPQALARAEHRAELARARASRFALLAAQAGEMARARTTLAGIEQELTELPAAQGPDTAAGQQRIETPEEAAEHQQIHSARQAIAAQNEQQAEHYRATLDRLKQALAALPAPYDGQQLIDAQTAMEQAAQSVTAAEQAHLAAVRDVETLAALMQQATALAGRQAQVTNRIAKVETELGNWNLFAKCMSNDGLIALAIDDAGPALAGLANDLLLACYGPRFTVSLQTLVETGKGEQKEGFDIRVHDGESGESKSVGLMSGGERVWINECLIRAVALYLAQHTGRRYGALFSDEADGPLDPERKRMFMAMKREVLRLGGYQREFFVSQTQELTTMADAVIDLDAHAESCKAPAGV
ncbi:MAG: DNA repair protein [Gammaproteobacteria bacterium]|nr:DNA repair protein [Gammaproteobacteria bacterium]MBU1602026.1 DNA repair protein [Gammaproteobacteria bacterium]MBU2434003.1 DNA repair protein [Gammaproteobacteria bacterium]MBU2447827.1 DNA repair protein [Gammaproteobacteria bacterium]